jgi:hypothetical protein
MKPWDKGSLSLKEYSSNNLIKIRLLDNLKRVGGDEGNEAEGKMSVGITSQRCYPSRI